MDDKQEAALIFERGSVLRHGDLLRAENGLIIEVCAADEEVAVSFTQRTLFFLLGLAIT